MTEASLQQYYADAPPTIVQLEIKPHWDALTDEQKLYAHYISRASFQGTRIILRQVSHECEAIYDFILTLYHHCNGNWGKLQIESGTSDDDLSHFLNYAAQFLGNVGNYNGFGDSKFIPRCRPEVLDALARGSTGAKKLLGETQAGGGGIYADPRKEALLHLGFPDQGHLSAYYPDSADITKAEIELIDKFLAEKNLLLENTRIRKLEDGNFELLVASALVSPPQEEIDSGPETSWILPGVLHGKRLDLKFGDYIEEMAKVAINMKRAGLHAANNTQKMMIDEYVKSFSVGSLNAFKESQKHWVKDLGPAVEVNIGFIESYRDPAGVRAEWEGMVAMINQERTKAFQKLVDAAPQFIPKLPWPHAFERDKFAAPDFTSLEVLTFSGSGIPAGINIPNYDDVRQEVGFKNVSLGNVLSAKAPNEKSPFIRPEDLLIYQGYRDQAFEVQVGIHELLGHGTGKLLQETSLDKYNFDIDNPPVSPVTKKPCTTWYKLSQTWNSVFGSIASSYEECRAECVAMALCCDFEILKIFGFGDGTVDLDGKAGDILYTSYLSMARAGVLALEFWDPKSKKWGQAHMQARFSILQTFLGVGEDFVKLEYNKDDLSHMAIKLDKYKILSHGRPAVERYLQKLHVYKCTADLEEGKKLYDKLTHVDEFWGTTVRDQVLRNKQPRKVFVQANTFEKEGKVILKEYEATPQGIIQSYAERNV